MTLEMEKEPIRFPDGTERSLVDLLESAAPGAIIELAPGRYAGPLTITRPVTIRGAGDLTRIFGERRGAVLTIRAPGEGRVVVESLLIEDGASEAGGGIFVIEGLVRLHNVQIQHCQADQGGGGAIHVAGGELDATLLRAHDVSGDRGGAVWAGGRAVITLRDSQIRRSEARLGGALAIEGSAKVLLEGLTIGRSRATSPSGGQAIYVAGSSRASPVLKLRRVRFEDAPMGMPLFVDPAFPGEVSVTECDLPRIVLGVPGIVDGGENRWR